MSLSTTLSLPPCAIQGSLPSALPGMSSLPATTFSSQVTYGPNTAPTMSDDGQSVLLVLESMRDLFDPNSVLWSDGSLQLFNITIDALLPVIRKVKVRIVYSVDDPGTEQLTLELSLNPELTGERLQEAIGRELAKALAVIAEKLEESHPGATYLVVFETSREKEKYSPLPANFKGESLEDDEGILSSTLKALLRTIFSPQAALGFLLSIYVVAQRQEKQRDAQLEEWEKRRQERLQKAEEAIAQAEVEFDRIMRARLSQLPLSGLPGSNSGSGSDGGFGPEVASNRDVDSEPEPRSDEE